MNTNASHSAANEDEIERHLAPAPSSGARKIGGDDEPAGSAVCWPAALAGAACACALSFALLLLGAGLGLGAAGPYAPSMAKMSWGALAWLGFVQLASAGIGGYLAGRLRRKWTRVHGDEAHFRDTAHGLLAWSVSTLIALAALGGAIKSLAPASADLGASTSYFADVALRAPAGAPLANNDMRAETGRALAMALAGGALTSQERAYLAQLSSSRGGVTPDQAAQAIDDAYGRMRQAADDARREGARGALWMFCALLLGAFCASLSATWGGRARERSPFSIAPTPLPTVERHGVQAPSHH